ncbi:MAG: RagB/SusD family nutrient uptake outer membrane protein [Filimonas sp.]|nr:RagB/SusD family nutrient uptake outer membrane protein [Filimonas sp.]
MKRIKKYIYLLATGAVIMTANSCSNKLKETPYTVNTVAMFQNAQGIQLALNGVYSGMRYIYGPEGANIIGDAGTDMWWGNAGGAAGAYQISAYTFDYTDGSILTLWNRTFNGINMCNGIIKWAPGIAGIDTANVIGQARFLRALSYLNLVSQFGAIPVDLGSGDYAFNQSSFAGFNRLPLADILTKDWKLIISDLTYAAQNLPNTRITTGSNAAFTLYKAAAYGLLAKAYIFKGYSANAEATDWQNAYNAAMQVINNQATYGCSLLKNYADVTAPAINTITGQGGNYNPEILFAIERIPGDLPSNEESVYNGLAATSGGKDVNASNDYNMSYDATPAPVASSSGKPCATRTPLYGRPLRVICPTDFLYNTLFADKTNDSRYDGTFNSVYLCTVQTTSNYQSGSSFSGNFTYNIGDTAIVVARNITEYNTLVAAQLKSAKPYRVISPAEMPGISGTYPGAAGAAQPVLMPSMMKYWDPARPNANEGGGRPYPVLKLSEVYLLAAEAAMQLGNNPEAVNKVNVLRTRAAFRSTLSATDVTTRTNAMLAATPATITLDFILDEHGRELAGEANRWVDLAMRKQLVNRVKLYNPPAVAKIQDYMMLRPIPKSQLDNLTVANPAQYQNPQW